jgi:hypothetical protein
MRFLVIAMFFAFSPNAAFAQQASLANKSVDEPAFRGGLLLMPYVGTNLALGDTSKAFNLGYRVGGIVGWHASPFLSLNGELTVDRPDPVDVENGYLLKATAVDLAFSPLFHMALDRGDLVIGPKIGGFRYTTSLSAGWSGEPPTDGTDYGLTYGLNLGVFGGIGDMAVGVLLGYTGRHATEKCPTRLNDTATCPHGRSELKLLSVAVAMLY